MYIQVNVHLFIFVLFLFIQELDEEEYKNWKQEREMAELSVNERDQRVFQSTCKMEHKLELLGEK